MFLDFHNPFIMRLIQQNQSLEEEFFSSLQNGAVIIFPTETIYGIGCSSLQDKAIRRVFNIKGRAGDQPPPVLVSDLQQLHQLVSHVPSLADELIKKFWPGSLTIIFPARDEVADGLCGRNEETQSRTIGIRMTAHPIARMLCQRVSNPIIATSANYSGSIGKEATPRTLEDIPESFKQEVDFVIDGGFTGGQPSTVVDCSGERPRVLRRGAIHLDF
jgi:L-threonylcarbamoyladenylate synthase